MNVKNVIFPCFDVAIFHSLLHSNLNFLASRGSIVTMAQLETDDEQDSGGGQVEKLARTQHDH